MTVAPEDEGGEAPCWLHLLDDDLVDMQPDPGPQRPLLATRPQPPSSVRRTITYDIFCTDGFAGPVLADVRGRDRLLDAHGEPAQVDELQLRLVIDPGGALASLGGHPPTKARGLEGFVGTNVRMGFGRVLATTLEAEAVERTLRYSILEDLSGALLVSGYSPLRNGLLRPDREMTDAMVERQSDVCIGWETGSPMQTLLAQEHHNATPYGPQAPAIEAEDPAGWHDLAPLKEGTVRRRRLLDVVPGDPERGEPTRLHSHFRDSYKAGDGDRITEMALHEYVVDATVADHGAIDTVEVEARTLPWAACPGAVPSAQQVVGTRLADLGPQARTHLVGPTTCTHLTSTLRMLADAGSLATQVAAPTATG